MNENGETSSCSSGDQDELGISKQVYSERSPLVDKSLKNATTARESADGHEEPYQTKTLKGKQHLCAIIATIGGFIMGTTLGWTSPAGPMLENGAYAFSVSSENVSWIAALMPVGALLGCPIMAGFMDKMGRKNLMIILTVPTLFGWALIIWAKSLAWIYAGRVITGFASGSLSLVVPLYTTEIAEKEIRGTLGLYFQLQVTGGILFSYLMGLFFNVFGLTVACAIIPLAYFCLIFLISESPISFLMKGDVENARSSLRFFRGPYANVDRELISMQKFLAQAEREKVSMVDAFQTKPAKLALFIGIGSMVFQQFSGANAVIFYSTSIFNETGSSIGSSTCTVIVGIIGLVSTYLSTLVIDKLGRKILLLLSVVAMGISTFLIGAFFYGKQLNYDVSYVTFVPLVSVCAFLIFFSIGFGPIPWMLMGEIFPAQIKDIACSIVCLTNWLFAFLVTKFFTSLVSAIYIYNTFWVFTFFCVLGTFFVLFIVPETKGKSMEEIQEMLGAEPSQPSP